MKKNLVLGTLVGILFFSGCGELEEKSQDQLNEDLRIALRDQQPLSIIRDLIKKGADVNARFDVPFTTQPDGNKIGFVTPLTFPVANGTGKDVSIIKELIDNGADVKVVFEDGSTLMHMAVLAGRDGDIIRYLAQAGAPVNAKNAFQQTPLFQAVYNENADEIAALIEAGADPNIKDADGQTIFEMIKTYHKEGALEPLQKAMEQAPEA